MKKKILIISIVFVSLIAFFSMNKNEEVKNFANKENIELAIYIEEEQTNSIPSKDSGYYLDLEKSSCTNNASITWDSTTWSPVILNAENYPVRCSLYFGSTYKESILNGTDPILKDELIPVTIDNEGVVRRASLTSQWYSYEEKRWANAVILKDESEIYADNEIIPEEKIESYFVWIPKYRYQIWDLGLYEDFTEIDESKVHEIPVIFGDYNTSDSVSGECTTPMTSGESGNCEVGEYMTHPAFLSIPSTGFWVGKFETGYDGATSEMGARVNDRDASKIVIKPNVYSWRSIQVANAFYTSYDYKRNLDSHMMKNTEWGAVAYLQHSQYGSATNVRINNNSNLLTGYQANNEPTCGNTGVSEECNVYCSDDTCNTAYPNSILASTTGNISGIFDMNGDAFEYVMGLMVNASGQRISGTSENNSGFNGTLSDGTNLTTGLDFPDAKYYDQYSFGNATSFYRRILGDATSEFGPIQSSSNSWYNGLRYFIYQSEPWFVRSTLFAYGNVSGITGSENHTGAVNDTMSFRLVLTPT